MGLLDSVLSAALGDQRNEQVPGAAGFDPQMLMGLVSQLLNQAGGLSGLLEKLQQGGLAEAAASWVGMGANQPVSPDALGSALGPDLMGQLAQALGGQPQQAAGVLADVLPGLIDQLTPQGQVPADNGLGAIGALLGGERGAAQNADVGAIVGALSGLLRR